MDTTRIYRGTTLLLSLLLLYIWSVNLSESAIQTIRVGAIFHEGDEELEQAFDQALSDLADEQNTYFRLEGVKRTNVEVDGWKSLRVICDLLQEEGGIAAIFGPRAIQTRSVASSIAGKFGIPHFEYTFRPKDDPVVHENTINLYPGNGGYERAIAEAVRIMNWHAFTYIFQTYEALARIQPTLDNRGRPNHPILLRELPSLKKIAALKSDKEREMVYETLVKNIHVAGQYSILLDVEHANLPRLLHTMKAMGLMGDYFMCLVVNLDSSAMDMRDFIAGNSIANVSHFKFVKDPEWRMSVEAALLYDAVFAFSDALNNLYKDATFSGENLNLLPSALSCYGEARYDVGESISALIRKKTKFGRKTGLMTFDENGERKFEFDLVNYQAGRRSKVGEWTGESLTIHRNEQEMNNTLTEAAKSKIFKVTTRVGSPYVIRVDEEDGKGRIIGDKKYEGYCIDLIEKIEEFLGIKCEFEIVPDGNYGSLNPVTKQWNGLIKRLLELKADMAICDLTITSERQSAVDFTAPFMNLGISILFSKAEKVVPALFSFMSPLSPEVWMYMATAYLIVSLMLFLQARIAPGEWINPHPCNPEPEELENSFTLMNCMWFTMGSLMQQGCDILPRAASIRLFAGIWYFFILIMVSSYTANLAAFLTAVKMEDSINDVQDLAKQTKIAYGALKGGSTYSFFKNSNTSLYQRLFNTMSDAKPSVFTKTNDEGVERVIKGKRKYAFFMESTTIEYQIQRHCELQQVGTLLDNKGYGIAMPPNSPYRTMISTAILHLQEKGELQMLKDKWWKEKGGGLCDEESDEPENSNELGMQNVGGVFLILMLGTSISILIAMGEFFWHCSDVAIEEKISRCEAFVQEIKFVFDFSKKTKPVKKGSSKKSSAKSSVSEDHEKPASAHESAHSSRHKLGSKDSLQTSVHTTKVKEEDEITKV